MASENRRTRPTLEDELFGKSGRFAFDQATKLLEQIQPERRPVGQDAPPDSEVVRFRSRLGYDFPAGDIEKLEPGKEGQAAEMTVAVMGLAGYQGPLPMWIGELIADRDRRGDPAARDFLDIFNHRLVSLLYRARRTLRTGLTTGPSEQLEIIQLLYSFLGLGQERARQQLPFEASRLLPFTGLFLPAPRSLIGLEQVLSGFFQTRVAATSLVGAWHRLESSQTTRIGRSGQNQLLGREAVLGRRIWDQGARLELRVGPIEFEKFVSLLPTGKTFAAYQGMIRLYAGSQQESLIRLRLKANELPLSRLLSRPASRPPVVDPAPSSAPRAARNGFVGMRLGWTSWLKTRPATRDDSQVVLRLNRSGPRTSVSSYERP